MKTKLKLAICLAFVTFGLQSCGNSGSNGGSNDVSSDVSNNEDNWSEMTFALDPKNAAGERTYSKFEVTLYADGTASTAYTELDGRSGTVECEWNLNDATYHNESAEMYLVNITINGVEESRAFRKGTNDAYDYIGDIIQFPEKVGRLTLGQDKKFVEHYRIIRKK